MISKLSELIKRANSNPPKTIVVAAAEDEAVLKAIKSVVDKNVAIPILVGNESMIEAIAKSIHFDLSGIEVINNDDNDAIRSAEIAIEQIHKGKASILMKGNIATGTLLKAVVNKEKGLRKSELLSHVSFFESPYYHKILCVTDVAMNIAPNLNDKVHIINNAVEACHKIGIDNPKVAVVAAVESVNPKMQATIDAAELKEMNLKGKITGCIIDGPLAIDNAVNKKAAELKGISGEVAGNCDIIIAPDIEAGNMFYKALNFLGGATSAAIIMGAEVPIVLTSRADNEQSKLLSIALAAYMK